MFFINEFTKYLVADEIVCVTHNDLYHDGLLKDGPFFGSFRVFSSCATIRRCFSGGL